MPNDTPLHPLDRARRILTLRLQALERTLPLDAEERDAWERWDEYVRTCDLVVRLIGLLSVPAAPITRRELGERFRKRA